MDGCLGVFSDGAFEPNREKRDKNDSLAWSIGLLAIASSWREPDKAREDMELAASEGATVLAAVSVVPIITSIFTYSPEAGLIFITAQ